MEHNTESILTDEPIPMGLAASVRHALKKYGFLGTLGRYVLMKDQVHRFVRDAGSHEERLFRKNLIRKFNRIQNKILCGHPPSDLIEIARYILDLEIDGPLVECGCFKGGSTAKLSLVAKHTGRQLYVCDSFAGLPKPEKEEEIYHKSDNAPAYKFQQGEYEGGLDEVKENIKAYGCIEVCEFIPGFFNESLPGLDIKPAFIFMDVDLISSARDCLKHLWAQLAPGGIWFTHEAAYDQYIQGVFDNSWWQSNLNDYPPSITGAGSGLSSICPALAYFRKLDSGKTT